MSKAKGRRSAKHKKSGKYSSRPAIAARNKIKKLEDYIASETKNPLGVELAEKKLERVKSTGRTK